MKWVCAILVLLPFAAFAQLPIPITPDWLKGDKEVGVLHSTQVQLRDNNYRVVRTNVTAKSGGFRLLGIITLKSPSYVKAFSRLYVKAEIEEGRPQAFANVVYETGGLNLLLFSLPKVRVRADLVEFTGPQGAGKEEATAVRTREHDRQRER